MCLSRCKYPSCVSTASYVNVWLSSWSARCSRIHFSSVLLRFFLSLIREIEFNTKSGNSSPFVTKNVSFSSSVVPLCLCHHYTSMYDTLLWLWVFCFCFSFISHFILLMSKRARDVRCEIEIKKNGECAKKITWCGRSITKEKSPFAILFRNDESGVDEMKNAYCADCCRLNALNRNTMNNIHLNSYQLNASKYFECDKKWDIVFVCFEWPPFKCETINLDRNEHIIVAYAIVLSNLGANTRLQSADQSM